MVFPQITTLWLSYSNSSTLGSLPRRLPLMNAPELPHPNSSNWSYLSLGVSPRWMLSYCLTLITVLRVLSPNVSPRWMLNDYPTPIAVLRVLFSPRWMLNAYFLLGPTPIAVRQARLHDRAWISCACSFWDPRPFFHTHLDDVPWSLITSVLAQILKLPLFTGFLVAFLVMRFSLLWLFRALWGTFQTLRQFDIWRHLVLWDGIFDGFTLIYSFDSLLVGRIG